MLAAFQFGAIVVNPMKRQPGKCIEASGCCAVHGGLPVHSFATQLRCFLRGRILPFKPAGAFQPKHHMCSPATLQDSP